VFSVIPLLLNLHVIISFFALTFSASKPWDFSFCRPKKADAYFKEKMKRGTNLSVIESVIEYRFLFPGIILKPRLGFFLLFFRSAKEVLLSLLNCISEGLRYKMYPRRRGKQFFLNRR
jgi:hypothetical protein